ncbi:MAG: TonB-dependent receptor [Prevotellaceae bacterium]|jgi:TonB-linked SusC/RagA family outer membrane protein|nr:TonB-dependent receptor [Prevotellaceae bacterium]
MEKRQYELVLKKIRMVLPSTVLFAVFALLSLALYANDTSGQSFNSEYSIMAKNKQISDILYSISKQTGIEFLFSPEGIQSNRRVDYSAEHKTVKSFLDEDLKSFGIDYEVINDDKVLLVPAGQADSENTKTQTVASWQDNNRVTGKVVDSKNNPVEFVTVHEKGTTNGTYTQQNGTFSINVANTNATLVFSSIGFETQEIELNGKTDLNVSLKEETNMLSEVIAVGYSSKTRAELSSSITTIKAADLLDVTTSDVGKMLQGKAAGVFVTNATGQPGSPAEIRIRGTGSISAQADPLYVVDGIIGGDFNPNDIETLTVLKDAGATAMYGSSAAGGVIVVTTKHASQQQQKTQVNFKATMGFKNVTHGNLEMMNGRELYKAHRSMMSQSLFELQRPNILARRNFDWLNAAFDQGFIQNYYASVSGKTEKMSYFISADYYDEDGTLINTDFRQLKTRGNFSFQLHDKVKLNTRIAVSNAKTNSYPYMTLQDAYKNLPWDYPYDVYGNYVKIDSDKRPDGSKWYSQDKRNFLHSEQYNYNRSVGNSVVADAQLIWTITDWLTFESSNRAGFSFDKYTEYVDPRTYHPDWQNGYMSITDSDFNSIATTNLLKASKVFRDHSISGFAGMEGSQWKSEYATAAGTDIPIGLESLSATIPHTVRSNRIPGKGLSFLAQGQYGYRNKFFATVSFRTDGSSVFGPDKRWGYFPAASASWLISNENFIKDNVPWISYLKLRASYGVTGNSNIGAFGYVSNYAFTSNYLNIVGATPENLANLELGWETAHMTNLGIDFNVLNNRINLNLDLYNIENKDLLLWVPQSPTTGFDKRLLNAGSVRNQGIEIQIESNNLVGEFKWSTNFNIAFNKNKVLDLPEGKPIYQPYGSTPVQHEILQGRDIYTWYLPKWLGVDPDTGRPVWEKITRDDNGNITNREATFNYDEAAPQDVGKATAVFTGGITNTLSYKGISLSINCNFVLGNKVYNYDREVFDADGAYLGYNMIKLRDNWSRWEKPGDIASHPQMVMNGNNQSNKTSSRYLENGSFFRVKNITLSYDLPTKWINKLKLSRCKIFASGDNLFTFTKFSGMDPEVSLKSGDWQLAGLYSYSYPISRQFIFGVDIYF